MNRRHREYLLEGAGSHSLHNDALDAMFGGGGGGHSRTIGFGHLSSLSPEELRHRKRTAERISAWTRLQYDRRQRNASAQRTIARAWRRFLASRTYYLRRHERRVAEAAAEAKAAEERARRLEQRKFDAGLVILYYYLKYRVRTLTSRIDAICDEVRARPDRAESARALQRFWRASVARIRALKAARIRAKGLERSLAEEQLLMAAVKAQSLYRALLARRRVAERRRRIAADEAYAAGVIQRNVRAFLAKLRADEERLGHLSMFKEYRRLMRESESMGWSRSPAAAIAD